MHLYLLTMELYSMLLCHLRASIALRPPIFIIGFNTSFKKKTALSLITSNNAYGIPTTIELIMNGIKNAPILSANRILALCICIFF